MKRLPRQVFRRDMITKEFPLEQLILTLVTMLIGKEGVDYSLYEFDAK